MHTDGNSVLKQTHRQTDTHNDEGAARNLPYFSFKTAPTLNLTLPVSYWLKFYTKILAENQEPIVQ